MPSCCFNIQLFWSSNFHCFLTRLLCVSAMAFNDTSSKPHNYHFFHHRHRLLSHTRECEIKMQIRFALNFMTWNVFNRQFSSSIAFLCTLCAAFLWFLMKHKIYAYDVWTLFNMTAAIKWHFIDWFELNFW